MLHLIAGASVDDPRRRAFEGELQIRQIAAYEAAATESADATRKLIRLTVAIALLTVVLVALTVVLAVQD